MRGSDDLYYYLQCANEKIDKLRAAVAELTAERDAINVKHGKMHDAFNDACDIRDDAVRDRDEARTQLKTRDSALAEANADIDRLEAQVQAEQVTRKDYYREIDHIASERDAAVQRAEAYRAEANVANQSFEDAHASALTERTRADKAEKRVEQLDSLCDELRAFAQMEHTRADKAEADAAAMREAHRLCEARLEAVWGKEDLAPVYAEAYGAWAAHLQMSDAGRVLLAERDALKANLDMTEIARAAGADEIHRLKAEVERLGRFFHVNTRAGIDGMESLLKEVSALTAALGRAHAALISLNIDLTYGHGVVDGAHEDCDLCKTLAEARAVLADPTGQRAAEMLQALEAEHDAYARRFESTNRAPMADVNAAHARVEALRAPPRVS